MIERFIDEGTDAAELPQQVPPELWDYAKAFLHLSRPSARFIWRHAKALLDVQFVLQHPSTGSTTKPRVWVTIRETELPHGLTPREFDVLTLVAMGLTNASIGTRLGTSTRTVSTHIERLLTKLEQSSRSGLAALAVDNGLLRLPLPGGPLEDSRIGVAALECAAYPGRAPSLAPLRSLTVERSPIRLGVVVPEDMAGDSEQMVNGITLAVEEIAEQGGAGGRPVEVVWAPARQFEWESVQGALQHLFDHEVDAVVTNYISAEHPDFLEAIADYGRPFLHTATFDADIERVRAAPYRYSAILQTCASEIHYAPGMLRVLTSLSRAGLWHPARRRISVLEQPSPSTRVNTPEFQAQAQELGWNVAETTTVQDRDTDWDALVDELRAQSPDVVLVADYLEQDWIDFQSAFLRRPFPALIYGIYAPSIPSLVERLGPQADGVIWATTTSSYDDEIGRQFREHYRNRFKAYPGWSQAGAAYDQVWMLASAWTQVDPHDAAEVIRFLRLWPFRGINGVYHFGKYGHVPLLYPDTTSDAALSQAHSVYEIRHGEHVRIAPEPFGSISNFRLPPWLTHRPPSCTYPSLGV